MVSVKETSPAGTSMLKMESVNNSRLKAAAAITTSLEKRNGVKTSVKVLVKTIFITHWFNVGYVFSNWEYGSLRTRGGGGYNLFVWTVFLTVRDLMYFKFWHFVIFPSQENPCTI